MDQKELDNMLPLEHHCEDDSAENCQELKKKINIIVFKIREKKRARTNHE
jgi:hypothetical protein